MKRVRLHDAQKGCTSDSGQHSLPLENNANQRKTSLKCDDRGVHPNGRNVRCRPCTASRYESTPAIPPGPSQRRISPQIPGVALRLLQKLEKSTHPVEWQWFPVEDDFYQRGRERVE